jgi:hypothetical protein
MYLSRIVAEMGDNIYKDRQWLLERDYRIRATELYNKAKGESDPLVRFELESLARIYLRYADEADGPSRINIAYDAVPARR